MKNCFSVVLAALALVLVGSVASMAQDRTGPEQVQKFIGQDGRMVYTNVVVNPQTPAPTAPAAAPPASKTNASNNADFAPINALIDSIAGNHGVDSDLVKAVVLTESNFDRWAVSVKGARGLMQLIPTTGARYGVRDFFDPKQNIEGGVSYLKFLLEKFHGNLDLSLAAYNAGENLVERLGRIPPIAETRDYVRKVRASYGKPSIPVVQPTATAAVVEPPKIFKTVDERGVFHYSNVAPQK